MEQPNATRALEVMSEVMQMPFQVVQREVKYEWNFAINHFAGEVASDDEPPIRIGARSDTIGIDGVLGLYNPALQQITIFRKGINLAAERLSVRPRDLTFIVRIHEWAHALLHLGLSRKECMSVAEDETRWAESLAKGTTWFEALESELHERLAQLITYHGLRSIQSEATLEEAQAILARILQTFDTLTRQAGSEYQIDEFVSVPKERILKSIQLLKEDVLIGASAWKTVITW